MVAQPLFLIIRACFFARKRLQLRNETPLDDLEPNVAIASIHYYLNYLILEIVRTLKLLGGVIDENRTGEATTVRKWHGLH